ncbi:TIGR02680 family protein [Streptomyces scabiei]|uniref:TIGR02680 family protein n=1 Tax=Streptomyces scabiei TaxID=1930 RepID=UPI000765D053|nr:MULTISPECIES: TIGR02680 family protein [Streptomyces]MBP5870546.1 TIGR02680 family protein [Streptomyces sp. LBUM 1485]MDW8476479.1 TIGR02680 family protein [Streptomyces scabiei]MDX2565919.1 TIGR02680 family protein [Streptomyces scabiei]MDX2829919.1 TIGR02680 family protein [Streptomyces scabiei]MDX3146028.1 TIGR02680 family protein [Streptomyces scabiei]
MTLIPHSRTADESEVRFKPTRAGVIGLWDYTDEEFVFADGRLVLRGHNGSGKTKALEVLFPLVLDGVLDARRLDPFSGEERTMKSNLLYKGQESAYGYVWMEFARTDPDGEVLEAVTVGIGMRVTKAMSTPARFFFVTDGRVGIDFGLLDGASRPLREKALEALLGKKAIFDTAEAYREKIDDRLFGLGRERYSQLVSLLLQLRRPLLAKDLDPVKLSETLTAGLRPVDDDLILQAARDFENLAEIQALLNALTGADTAVRNFLRDYTTYLRAHARDRIDHVTGRIQDTAAQCEKIMEAAEDRRASERQLASAQQERDAAERQCNELGARLAEYKDHDAIKQRDGLKELRDRVHAERQGLAESERHLSQAQKSLATLKGEAERAVQRHGELRKAASRHTDNLMDAARSCGILHDDATLDLGAELDTDVAGRVAARRSELKDVHAHLGAFEDARKAQEREQDHCDTASGELTEAERQSTAAAERLEIARTTASQELDEFISRWSSGNDITVLAASDGDALRAAVDAVGEPEAAPLLEVFRSLTDQRRTRAAARVDTLEREHSGAADALRSRQGERDTVAAEADDAPPPSDLRPASRDERPGAPLWQLVQFADHVPEDHAAAVEGALYGAGLLTAWLHPDPVLTDQALHDKVADAYLRPLPPAQRPTGPTLADLLVVEDQQLVAAATVQAVLASIAVTDDIPATDDALPAPAVTTGSHFSLGVQVGAHPKEQPEYIGATARAARRRERLRVLDESIAALEAQLAGIEEQQRYAQEAFDDFDRARRELPRTRPITEAVGEVAVVAEKVTGARRRLAEARKRLDGTIARAHEKNRQLRHAATAARLPTVREELDKVAQALDDFAGAGKALSTCREQADAAERDIAGRRDIIATQTESCTEQAEALQARKDAFAVQEERLRTQEATLEAPLQEILQQIADAEVQLTAARKTYGRARKEAEDQRDRLLKADHALEFGSTALATAVAEQVRTTLTLEPYARPDLLGLLEANAETVWLPQDVWPSPEQAVQTLMDSLTSPGTSLTGIQAAQNVVPASVASLINALDEATRGRPITASLLKTVTTKISTAITALEAALLESDQGYLFEWEPAGDIILARVTDSEGPAPVADFARRLAEQLADQSVLLEDKERTVLEDGLLTGLAEQIHDRTVAARDLVRSMDADTRSKPMSSGQTVGINWVISDALTDSQQAVNKLLDKNASGLGPAGLADLRSHLRSQIRTKAAADKKRSYQQVIAEVLDYRTWRKFELRLFRPGMSEEERKKGDLLTKAKHSVMSGGEKSASIHLPLFAAAHAQYTSAYPTCPRLIALDEAFAGIDEKYRPDLLALTAKFDLDLFMTGYDLWITYPDVPQISHYDMKHDEASHTVSAMLLVWDGEQILDDLEYPGSDDLAAELLGFTPRRHVPAQAGLLADIPDDEPTNDDTEEAE